MTHQRLIDRINLELSVEVAGELRRLSDRTGNSMRSIVEAAMRDYLAKLKNELRDTAEATDSTPTDSKEGDDLHAS